MKLTLLTVMMTCWLALASPAALQQETAASDPVRVEGTRVSISVPDGFTPLAQVRGFGNSATGQAIHVSEIPGTFEMLRSALNDPVRLEKSGLVILNRESLACGPHEGELYECTQAAKGKRFHKWLWAFGSGNESILVAGETPQGAGEAAIATARAAVVSARWDLELIFDPLDALPYEFTKMQGMKIAVAGGTGVIFVPEDFEGSDLNQVAHLEVRLDPASRTIPLEKYAEQALLANESFKKPAIRTIQPVEIDGLSGFEVHGSGIDPAGNLFHSYDVVLGEGLHVIHITSRGSVFESAEFLPRFESMAHSFRRKRTNIAAADNECQLVLPATWVPMPEQLPPGMSAHIHAVGQMSLTLFSSPKKGTADLKVSSLEDWMHWDSTESELLAREGKQTRREKINGLDALVVEYALEVDDVERAFLCAAIESKARFYTVRLSCPLNAIEASRSELTSILQSFVELPEEPR